MKQNEKESVIKALTIFIIVLSVIFAIFCKSLTNEIDELQNKIQTYESNDCKIQPCPFCGSTDVELIDGIYYRGRCNNCYFSAPAMLDKNGHIDEERNTKIDAINLWNSIEISVDE